MPLVLTWRGLDRDSGPSADTPGCIHRRPHIGGVLLPGQQQDENPLGTDRPTGLLEDREHTRDLLQQ